VADVALTGRLTTDPPVRDPTTAGPMLDGLLAANAAFAAGWWRIPRRKLLTNGGICCIILLALT
jgi:hypothetical protein